MRFLALTLLVLAGAPDAGARLSAVECELMVDTMITLSVGETFGNDPEIKLMNAEVKAATLKAAKAEALKDPRLAEMKKDCRLRFSIAARDCVLKAKTMKDVDVCMQL